MVMEQMAGVAKIEFCFGAMGIDLVQDEVTKVQLGSQAETKGVKAGWKITLINGQEMPNYADIRPALDRHRKSGKKFFVTFSKPAHEMQAELLAQQAAEQKKKTEQKQREKDDADRKKAEDEKKAADEAERERKKQEGKDRMQANMKQQTVGTGFVKPTEVPKPVERSDDAKKELEGEATVTLKYYDYTELFAIDADLGTLQLKAVDEFFGFSGVMAGCGIHLGAKEPVHGEDNVYLKEEPIGTVVNLEKGGTYYIFVVQDPAQEKKDMERMKGVWAGTGGEDGPRGEGCSCLYGTPCTDKYVCLDWENRMAVAKKNGMLPLAG